MEFLSSPEYISSALSLDLGLDLVVVVFLFRLVMKNAAMQASRSAPPTLTPTPIPVVALWESPEDDFAAAEVAAGVVVATAVLAIVVPDVHDGDEAVICDDLVEELEVLDVIGMVVSTVPAASLTTSLVLS